MILLIIIHPRSLSFWFNYSSSSSPSGTDGRDDIGGTPVVRTNREDIAKGKKLENYSHFSLVFLRSVSSWSLMVDSGEES